jgi:hypothetical protein
LNPGKLSAKRFFLFFCPLFRHVSYKKVPDAAKHVILRDEAGHALRDFHWLLFPPAKMVVCRNPDPPLDAS